MAWIKDYPKYNSKTELAKTEKTFSVTGNEPNPIGKGLFEVQLVCTSDKIDSKNKETDNIYYLTILTRRDIETIRAAYPKHFRFVQSKESSLWADVEIVEPTEEQKKPTIGKEQKKPTIGS